MLPNGKEGVHNWPIIRDVIKGRSLGYWLLKFRFVDQKILLNLLLQSDFVACLHGR